MALSNAERVAAHRARKKLHKTITIELNSVDADLLEAAFHQQIKYGKMGDFYQAALLSGAKFVANAGNSKKIKRGK